MTDTFGSEPQNHPEGSLPENEAPPESRDTITEEPPEYEFDEASPDGQPSDKPAKRSPVLPIVAALGGILLLGSVAWWQLSSSSPSALLPPVGKSALGGFSLPGLSSTTPPPSESGPGTSTADSASSAVSPKTEATASKEEGMEDAPFGASSSARPSGAENLAPQAKPSEAPAANEPAAAAVPASSLAEPTPIQASSARISPTPNSAAPSNSAPVSANAAPDRRVEDLTARVDGLQRALEQANQQLAQIASSMAAVSNANAQAASPNRDLQDKIDKLELQVESLSRSAPAQAAAVVAPTASDELAVPVVHKTVPTAKHKTAHKAPHKASKSAAAKTKSAENPVLRAAADGRAWISGSATSRDLKEIKIGDKVPGIGKVTAIEEDGDKWVVRGTKGSIQ